MQDATSAVVHIEFQLAFLIDRGGLQQPRPDRRLNALENMISGLARAWRIDREVLPGDELRMSEETLGEYIGWVQEKAVPDEKTVNRLAAYLHSIDENVPHGWVRLLLGARSSQAA